MTSLNEIFWEAFLFCFLLGTCVGFSLHHTEYLPTIAFADIEYGMRQGNPYKITAFCVFIFAEIMNFNCKNHYYLMTRRFIAVDYS